MPTMSMSVMPCDFSTSLTVAPASSVPSKIEYAGTPCPLRMCTSTLSASKAGWYSAPGDPATQCSGQVETKSGSAPTAKCPPLSESSECQSRDATTRSYSPLWRPSSSVMPAATAAPPSTPSAPPSVKSFCTSMMKSARVTSAPSVSGTILAADHADDSLEHLDELRERVDRHPFLVGMCATARCADEHHRRAGLGDGSRIRPPRIAAAHRRAARDALGRGEDRSGDRRVGVSLHRRPCHERHDARRPRRCEDPLQLGARVGLARKGATFDDEHAAVGDGRSVGPAFDGRDSHTAGAEHRMP